MDSLPLIAPIVGAAIDWLSMSCNRADSVAALFDWWTARSIEKIAEGYDAKPWGGHGYNGLVVDGIGIGSNGTSCIVKLSGENARRHWRALAMESTNVSRIDLAVTIRPDADVGYLARDQFESVTRLTRVNHRPVGYKIIRDSEGGESLAIGSRASDAYGRLYNKGAESKDPVYDGCWRYEVEYKRKAANARARALLASPSEAEAISGDVYRWFAGRGVRPLFAPGDTTLDVQVPDSEPDVERWLTWARKCVRPGAERAIARYGWFYVAEALCGAMRGLEDLHELIVAASMRVDELEGG